MAGAPGSLAGRGALSKFNCVTDAQYLSGRLLLAMPGMFDPRFDHSVNALCVHDENGAFGINLGRTRTDVTFHAVLAEMGIDPGIAPDCAVLDGGPVEQGRGFVLHSTDWDGPGTIPVSPIGALSTTSEVLRAIAAGEGPRQWLMALGYAGWGAGQLEDEMRQHGWYAAEGRAAVAFDTATDARWQAAWAAEGIDPAALSPDIGRA